MSTYKKESAKLAARLNWELESLPCEVVCEGKKTLAATIIAVAELKACVDFYGFSHHEREVVDATESLLLIKLCDLFLTDSDDIAAAAVEITTKAIADLTSLCLADKRMRQQSPTQVINELQCDLAKIKERAASLKNQHKNQEETINQLRSQLVTMSGEVSRLTTQLSQPQGPLVPESQQLLALKDELRRVRQEADDNDRRLLGKIRDRDTECRRLSFALRQSKALASSQSVAVEAEVLPPDIEALRVAIVGFYPDQFASIREKTESLPVRLYHVQIDSGSKTVPASCEVAIMFGKTRHLWFEQLQQRFTWKTLRFCTGVTDAVDIIADLAGGRKESAA